MSSQLQSQPDPNQVDIELPPQKINPEAFKYPPYTDLLKGLRYLHTAIKTLKGIGLNRDADRFRYHFDRLKLFVKKKDMSDVSNTMSLGECDSSKFAEEKIERAIRLLLKHQFTEWYADAYILSNDFDGYMDHKLRKLGL